jgi:hypothetical protein
MDEGEAAVLAAILHPAGPDVALEGPAWFAWRKAGRLVSGGWHAAAGLRAAVALGRQALAGAEADALELCLTRDYRVVPADGIAVAFPNSQRGRIGIEIRTKDEVYRVGPTTAISSNRPPVKEIERLALARQMQPAELLQRSVVRRFEADQFLIGLTGGAHCSRLWRGARLVSAQETGRDLLLRTIEGLCLWLRENQAADGRMTYKYWPSRGAESSADNTIRQVMATVALGRVAAWQKNSKAADAARCNLAYNLRKYYAEIDGVGAIILDGKAKLGATALAALAILEFRQTGLLAANDHAEVFDGLCRGVERLWQPDGAFRTFLVPADRNDNQNFYPGEALLFWATLHRHTREEALAEKCLASFRYYRDWHLAQPNPAFVPWHSQAYVMLHEDLGAPALADFVLDRNDWLLSMQQWGGGLAPDFWGRFYDPTHPEYGPPHASSTGVYMEGLADAWRLARRLGDAPRAERYARTLRRGLRAISQLQFRDREIDAFYISRPAAVMGGLRTETYNNEIRVDNVQHCLMALLKLAAEPEFPWHGESDAVVIWG